MHPNSMDPTRWIAADAKAETELAAEYGWPPTPAPSAPRRRAVTVERLASGCILYRVDFGPGVIEGATAYPWRR